MSRKRPITITITIEPSDGLWQIASKIAAPLIAALGNKRTVEIVSVLMDYVAVYKRQQREQREARERERARERIEGVGRVSRIKGKVAGTVIEP